MRTPPVSRAARPVSRAASRASTESLPASPRDVPSRSMNHRNAASVLPEPVGATARTSSPRAAAAHVPACTSVGSPKRPANHSRTASDMPANGASGPLDVGSWVNGHLLTPPHIIGGMSAYVDDDILTLRLAQGTGEILKGVRNVGLLRGRVLGDAGDALSQEWIARVLDQHRPDDA